MRQRIWQIFVIILVLVNLIVAGGAGIKPALAATQPAPRQALTFTPEEVDPNAVRGNYSAITVDAAGVPHIAYHDSTNGDLYMASKHGAIWLREEVDADSSNATFTGITPSIAIDADGLAHIAYYDQTNGDLRYARQLSPDGWVTGDAIIKVDTGGDVGWGASLALDSLQRPHIAYRDTSNHALKYAYFDGAAWQKFTVSGADDFWANSSVSLALTHTNLPRIAYRRSSGPQTVLGLGYASFNGTSWTVETAYAASSVGESFSLALDSRNVPHISFMDTAVGLRYVPKDPSWATPETVVANVNVGSLNNLALDPAGRVRIVYFDASAVPNTVKYAYKDGTSWRHELLANTATAPDLAFDSLGGAHISYQNANNKQGYIRLAPFPDLQVSDIWMVGSTVHFQLVNAGLGEAPAGFSAALSVNSSKKETKLITSAIPAGGRLSSSFSFTDTCLVIGSTPVVRVDADPGSVIAELTRSNNARQETWTCKGVKPVITAGPTVSGVTQTGATITWSTNTATDSVVNYGRRAGFLTLTQSNSTKVTSHSITLSGLAAGASYAFEVTSTDAAGQSVTSKTGFFTTTSPGGSISPLVTRSITKDAGPGEIYTLKASVPGGTGLEKVEFYYRLTPTSTPVLIGTAFGGTPAAGGTVEYATKFSPGKTNLSRQQLNGANIVTSVSIPGGSPQNFEDMFTPLNTPAPVVTITSPNPDYTLYVDSWPTSGKKLTVKAHAEAYEWDCDWSGADPLPDCDTVKKPVDKVRLWIAYATPVEIIPAANQYDFETEFTLFTNLPMDFEVFAQAFSGDTHITTNIPAHIKIGTPIASLERAVTRVGNTFHVVLTIMNDAAATGALVVDGLYDYARGFQPVFDDVGDVKVVSTYTPSTRINKMYFDLDQGASETRSIPIGGSYSFSYDLIPVIYENNVQYAIGEVNVTSLIYKVGSDERYQYFNLPVSVVPDPTNISLAASVAKALKEDDYLLVTHPANLNSVYGSTTAEPNWNTLLRRMAELADLRQGALAYLDSQDADTLNDLLEPEFHIWADKLHPNYSKYAQGYVLLVGEDNIVPSYTKTGLEGGTVRMTDNPLAHTGGSGAPDLVLGRLPGDDIPQLIAPIVTSLKVLRGELVNDRSKALGTSGTGDGIQGFQDSAQNVKSNLQSLGVTVSLYHEEEKARTATISVSFDDGDLLASGDINGDGAQELLIGDVSTDDIYVVFIDDQGFNRVKLFHYPEDIKSGHGFAVGDLDGDLKDELVIADDIDRLFVYRCPFSPSLCNETNPPDSEFFTQPFDNWDKLAIGNVDSDPEKEMIIAHAGTVTMRNNDGTPAGVSFPMAFSAEDDIAVGRIWNNDDIVEIVLMDASLNEGRIYSVNGTMHNQFPAVYSEGDFVIAMDIDGDPSDTKPEEVFVLNSSGNAIQGYYRFGSDPAAIFIPQRVIEGDKIAALKLEGETRPAIWLVKRDDNTYQLDRDYPEYIQSLYLNAATEADYLYYRGHGSSTSWESIYASMLPVPEFGSAAPLAYGTTCLSGDYSVDASASLSERMLWWGAGAFIGSTEVSYGSFNDNAAIWMSNHLKDAGPFARLLLQYKNKKWDDGTIYNNCDWPYWVHEYNFYGDAKFGFIGDTTQLPYPDAAPRLLESDTLTVNLPAYTVVQKDGYDYVDIPHGDVTTNEGELRIPYYVETRDYPAGTRVSGVTLTARGGKTTASGLILPPYVIEIDGQSRPLPDLAPQSPSAPDEFDWTPTQDQVFTWNVVERVDGTSQLVIRLHPFYYSPATTNVEYYTSYDFTIETTATKQEITRLATDKAVYRLNEAVAVDALIKNNSTGAANLLVSATLFNAGGSPVSGTDMRLLNNLAGDSSTGFNTTFDTNALPAGSYYVEMELRDTAGKVVDTETVDLELGMRAAQVEVSAAPTFFKPGNLVSLQLAVSNIGDLLLSGAMAQVVVLDEAGVVVASFSQLVADLVGGASTSVPFSWNTTGVTGWRYTVQGRVLYGSQSSPEDSFDVVTHARFFLPVISK